MAELRAVAGLVVAAAWLAASATARAETRTVVIEGMQFAPIATTVKRGDTVVWVNRDFVAHTVTSADRFDSGPIVAGASWRFVPGAPGRYEYICTLHPTMKATLVVE